MSTVTEIDVKVVAGSASKALSDLANQARKTEDSIEGIGNKSAASGQKLSSSFAGAGRVLGTIAGTLAGFATGGFLVNTIKEFESLRAVLKTTEGSSEAAEKAFRTITDFTAKTPFQVEEVTRAFTNLRTAGITPTVEQLNSFGNISASFNRSISDFSEAVQAATVGEFDRLRGFGILVRKEGDQLAVSFRGVTTTIENSTSSIIGYLENLGNTEFSGGIANQAATLNGVFSNISDNLSLFALRIGDAGLTTALSNFGKAILEVQSGSNGLADALGRGLAFAVNTVTQAILLINDNIGIFSAALAGIGTAVAVNAFVSLGQSVLNAASAFRLLGVALLANPLGLIATAVAAAVAAFILFKDETVVIGDVTASVGEVIGATWSFATDLIVDGVNLIISGFNIFRENLAGLGEFFKGVANNLIGIVVGLATTIKDIIISLPSVFVETFNFIGTVLYEFGAGLIEFITSGFESSSFEPFTNALTTGLGAATTAALGRARENFSNALSTDYVGAVGSVAFEAGAAIGERLTDGLSTRIVELRKPTQELGDELRKLGDQAQVGGQGIDALGNSTANTSQRLNALGNEIAQVNGQIAQQNAAIEQTAVITNTAAQNAQILGEAQRQAAQVTIDSQGAAQQAIQQTGTVTQQTAQVIQTSFGSIGSSIDSLLNSIGIKSNGIGGKIGSILDTVGRIGSSLGSFGGQQQRQSTSSFSLFGGSNRTSSSSSFLGSVGNFIGGLFREEGGPVQAGRPYIVGERRPELFVPNRNGTILPNTNALQSGSTFAPVINLSLNGGVMQQDIDQVIEALGLLMNEQQAAFTRRF